MILGRYFLIAGGAFWLFYSACKVAFLNQAISHAQQWKLIRQDIALSISSAFLFAFLGALILTAYQIGNTRLYASLDEHGWWYLGVSFCVILVLQDTYFYFTHRLLHHPRLFKRIHRGHHRSQVPTPWTSFAFEPSEALLHGLFFVVLVFTVPIHFVVLIAALITMTLWAIATHLGFELIPSHSPLGWLGRGLIGPIHHGIHHHRYQVHFGLYFTFWDHIFQTTDPAYLEQYPSKPSP